MFFTTRRQIKKKEDVTNRTQAGEKGTPGCCALLDAS